MDITVTVEGLWFLTIRHPNIHLDGTIYMKTTEQRSILVFGQGQSSIASYNAPGSSVGAGRRVGEAKAVRLNGGAVGIGYGLF